MSTKQKASNKVTVYMDDPMYDDLKLAAELQQRSVSWIVAHSWRLSRSTILGWPSVDGSAEDDQLAS